MAVENRFILKKMAEEIEQATRHDDGANFIKHVEHIKLLCELVLDSNKQQHHNTDDVVVKKQAISVREMEAMLGSKRMNEHTNQKPISILRSDKEEDTNGTSIFDF